MTQPAFMSEPLDDVVQLPQPDPRGWLALQGLPRHMQAAEDATQAFDKALMAGVAGRYPSMPRTSFMRPATDAERRLLSELLGHQLPDRLVTVVRYHTNGVRERWWPQLIPDYPARYGGGQPFTIPTSERFWAGYTQAWQTEQQQQQEEA